MRSYIVFRLPRGSSYFRWNGSRLELWLPDTRKWCVVGCDYKVYREVRAKCPLVAKNVVFK